MSEKPFEAARNTVMFLLMTASQMRGMLDEPDLPSAPRHQLRHMAAQCEAEARELSEEFGIELGGRFRSN